MDKLNDLHQEGQSIWIDYIRRDLITGGKLQKLVEEGVRGLTSNPTIFQKALAQDSEYDEEFRNLLKVDPNDEAKAYYESLVISDVQRAADILRPVFEDSDGGDGFVSLEVSPHLAYDLFGTIEEARHLWQRVDRPNLMIKVPATPQGIDAIESLIAEGINVNVTLLFSIKNYDEAANAYIRGIKRSQNPHQAASVASFFVSRIDTYVDRELERIGTEEALNLRGKAATANSKLAYHRFHNVFHIKSFTRQIERGARVQRILWGSTSTKNPAYSDVKYVDELIGQDTVNTMPLETLEAFRDHGRVHSTLTEGVEEARKTLSDLANAGVDMDAITEQLLRDGVKAFADSYDQSLEILENKRTEVAKL